MSQISKKKLDKLISISYNLLELPQGRTKHFSFLIYKNKIISLGYNNFYKTHPKADKHGYYDAKIHSELHCINNARNIPKKSIIVNVRIDKNKKICMSKPCEHCQEMLIKNNIEKVIYTTGNKEWQLITLTNQC